MTATQLSPKTTTETTGATGIATKLEVVTLPVADVDRAKAFYQGLGWRLDIDFHPTPDSRGVQFTHEYVQKSTRTTRPRNASAVSGSELSQVVEWSSCASALIVRASIPDLDALVEARVWTRDLHGRDGAGIGAVCGQHQPPLPRRTP